MLQRLSRNPRIRALALGQLISLLIAGTGVFSTLLAERGIELPTMQGTLNYILLLSFAVARFREEGTKPLRLAWWKYALLAVADVEANTVIVAAYSYTSLTSVMLLDCATIPFVMLLSRYALRAQYARQHLLGVAICLAGMLVLFTSDVLAAQGDGGDGDSSGGGDGPSWLSSRALLGDALCVLASALYAISNVGQEAVVKANGRLEYLGGLGVFGTLLSGAQALALELPTARAVTWEGPVVGSMLGFAGCLFAMYALTSHFLVACDATLFNLSLLTSDVWAVLAATVVFGQPPPPLYFLAFAVISVGLVVYNRAPPPVMGESRLLAAGGVDGIGGAGVREQSGGGHTGSIADGAGPRDAITGSLSGSPSDGERVPDWKGRKGSSSDRSASGGLAGADTLVVSLESIDGRTAHLPLVASPAGSGAESVATGTAPIYPPQRAASRLSGSDIGAALLGSGGGTPAGTRTPSYRSLDR